MVRNQSREGKKKGYREEKKKTEEEYQREIKGGRGG